MSKSRAVAAMSAPASSRADHARWIPRLVAAFLLFQLLLPLRYYLSAPTPDERFAWRMFSSQHMKRCDATIHQIIESNGRRMEVQVPPMVLTPWQRMLNRNRPDVVQQVMRSFAQRPGVIGVRFTLDCRTVDGAELPAEVWWLDAGAERPRRVEDRAP